MSELFEIEESLSPKEAWKREHRVTALKPPLMPGETGDAPQPLDNFNTNQWLVRSEGVPDHAQGDTEEEALYNLSLIHGVKYYM